MNTSTYVLNPNYRLLNDVKRVLLVAVNNENSDPGIDYSGDFISKIHPLHAQILSFFNGDNDYQNTLDKLTAYLRLDRIKIEEFVIKLIENTEFNLSSSGNIVFFPKNVLVKKHDCKNFPVYDCTRFPLSANVDLVSQRFYMPRYFSLVLNTNCFTDCIYCYADRKTPISDYLPTKRILELIDEMIELEALKIDFDGGEVLLHPDHLTILSYAISKGFTPYISTKCTLNHKEIKELKNIGITKMQISLDSSKPEILSSLLATKSDYFEKMMETISYFEEEDIEIVVHCILTSYNKDAEEVVRLINKLLPFDNIKEINIDPAGYSLFKEKDSFSKLKISERDLSNIRDTIASHQDIYKSLEKTVEVKNTKMSCSIYNDNISKNKEFLSRPRCEGNVSAIFIMPDGKVTICEELYWHPQFILGDVTSDSIMDVWRSSKAHSLSNITQEDFSYNSLCKQCPAFNGCRGNNTNRICWKEVQYFYGRENWDYPQPSCPYAPSAFNDCLLAID